MFKKLVLATWLFTPFFCFAKNLVILSGKVVNDSNMPITNAQITLGKYATNTSPRGEFKLEIPEQIVYSLDVKAAEFYGMRFSYSQFELQSDEFDLGNITLIAKKKERVLLAFGGDVMMGRRYAKPYFNNPVLVHDESTAQDTQAIVQYMAPYIKKADFAAVNLETQIADKTPKERAPKSVTFYSPPEIVDTLKQAGIDYVTLGNNHTYDYLDSGLKSTIDALNQMNMPYSGAGMNEQEALAAYRTAVNGVDYAMLGYVGWEGGVSPSQIADADKGGAAYGSKENIIASVQREVAENRVTVAQYHGSLEYKDEPSMMTESRLKEAINQGADLAIAHHPHVVQGFEVYQGKLIAYSLGNFIFDQYFYATNHSFILYVWMDGEDFYRAEIVPVYIQGYVPTPATGSHRNRILARLDDLTSKRNTHFSRNAGHGVILPSTEQKYAFKLKLNTRNKHVMPLPNRATEGLIRSIETEYALRYRLGVNLINNADFETHAAFYSEDRGFNLDQSSFKITNDDAYSGQFSLRSNGKDDNVGLAMTNFTRVYRAGNPATVTAMVKGQGVVNIYWQGRKSRGKLFESLNNSKKHLIGSVDLNGNWQEISQEFNTPRVGYRSFRVLFEFETKQDVFIDDIALVEWRTPYLTNDQQAHFHNGAGQATYIGFESKPKSAIELMIQPR